MAVSWRPVSRLRGPRGKSIRTRSRRWTTYFQGGRRQPVYRKGRNKWLAGLGAFFFPGRGTDLPGFVQPMSGRDLLPLARSIEASNRARGDQIRFVSLRFLVTREGISASHDVDPDELTWVGGQIRELVSAIRDDLAPMTRQELQDEVRDRYCGPLIKDVTAIYSVSVQAAN